MDKNVTQDTLGLIKTAQANPVADNIAKAFTQSNSATTGLTSYDLEAPAKLLFPVLTPLRNRIPRLVGGFGTQANWRAITGINTSQMMAGVAAGKRSGAISHTTAEYLAAYRGAGLEDYVEFEAEYAGAGFDDVKARAVQGLLSSTMIQEEFIDLGGNTSVALGTCPTPTIADVTTGGSLLASTAYNVRCVAMTLNGYQQAVGYNNGMVGQSLNLASLTLARTITRTNMDSTTDTINGGLSQVSAQAAVTTAADASNTHRISATVTPVAGAVAYAWFWGTAGNEKLGAITTLNSVMIAATAAGAQLLTDFTTNAADNSTDSLVYDGILTQIMKSGSGSYVKDLATGTAGTGTKLTSNGAAGITEIDDALASFYNSYRLSPNTIYMGAQVLVDANSLIVKNGGAPLIRMNVDAGGTTITAGVVVGQYLNKITGDLLKIVVHPNMPAGMMMFWSDSVPYSLSGVANIVQKKLRREYYQIEWPLRTRRYEYGVYFDGVLQNYFPPAFGIIRNIAPGI